MTEGNFSPDETLFYICQIGTKQSSERKRADEVERFIIAEAAGKFGLNVVRSDKEPSPGQITTQIVRRIIESRVVVADVTGTSPNVFYELGIVHAFARPTVLLVKNSSAIPFDVHSERMIVVGDGEVLGASDAKEAARHLEAALAVVLAPGYRPSNLVTEAAARRSLDALAPNNPLAAELSAIRRGVDEVRWMFAEQFGYEDDEQSSSRVAAADRGEGTPVVDLMAALEASLAAARGTGPENDDNAPAR